MFYLFLNYVCLKYLFFNLYVWVYVNVVPEELRGMGSSEAGVTGSCEPPHVILHQVKMSVKPTMASEEGHGIQDAFALHRHGTLTKQWEVEDFILCFV